ncbi:MarR family winged helix-turn-helix transcriptional regulator [Paenibacillus alkalitolerans]|uniref:MarR family winged helix-turn-helix transcriptional regulator n=1 Tax=Paenibacillus alkalitolerans TaxID=2799335 RepID=UPI001F26E347|nr:MarR family winged helix-turn-helix transcriptional regulator [Paenibacillus alkalitolerans]
MTIPNYVHILVIMNNHSMEPLSGTVNYAAECTCLNLRKATRYITGLYDECLRPVGLRATQLPVLMALAQAGSVTISRLSEILLMDRTTLTRDLKPLERQKLVSITTGEDRRRRYISLTPAGEDLLASALPLWEQAQSRVRSCIGEDREKALLVQLSELVKLVR